MTPEEHRAAVNLVLGLRQVGDDLARMHIALGNALQMAGALLTRAEQVLGIGIPPTNHRPPPRA